MGVISLIRYLNTTCPIPLAARSNAWVYGLSIAVTLYRWPCRAHDTATEIE